MKDRSISQSITLGLVIVLVLFSATTLVAFLLLHQSAQASKLVATNSLPALTLAANLRSEVSEIQVAVFRHRMAATPEEKTSSTRSIEEHNQRITGILDTYANYLSDPAENTLFNKIAEARAVYVKSRGVYLAMNHSVDHSEPGLFLKNSLLPAYSAYLQSVDALANFNADTGLNEAIASELLVHRSQFVIISGSIGSLIAGLAIAIFISRRTSRSLDQIAQRLHDSAELVATYSLQVSGSSQSLAQGASEQAAALEETSASLEEMSAMTRHNAVHAQEAKTAAGAARKSADIGAGQMQGIQDAMQAINNASDDISKILKTIDQIAFQTNILALNAAVEAARAGEHGAGFAVVAEEVRALAHRSAQAAKETAAKIDDTVTKSQQGVQIGAEAAKSFNTIQKQIRELDQLVVLMASASTEQDQGISQVNIAVSQMDDVTQSNAGNAEETASASEELSAQAQVMKQAVEELQILVGKRHHSNYPDQPLSNRKPLVQLAGDTPLGKSSASALPDNFFQNIRKP